jgi:hypothetical protein
MVGNMNRIDLGGAWNFDYFLPTIFFPFFLCPALLGIPRSLAIGWTSLAQGWAAQSECVMPTTNVCYEQSSLSFQIIDFIKNNVTF